MDDHGSESPPDVDSLVQELRRTVEERRAAGEYPPGLEDDLEAHFRRIVTHRVVPDLSQLDSAVSALKRLQGLSPERISTESGVPGGAALHRTVQRVVSRQAQGILEQVQELSSALQAVVLELSRLIRLPDTHVHPDLVGQVDALQERLTALERNQVDDPAGLAEVGRRLERLEAAEAARRFRPTYSSEDFEGEFRGSEAELKDRYRDLARRLEGCGPVLEIGCGRGEFLELLSELGIEGRGVELDPELAAAATRRGLDVGAGDGLAALAAVADGSLGGLVLVQVVEHLSRQGVVDLVSLATDKVRAGGRVVIETVNPQSLYVYARAFYADPTHDRPVHPRYLSFLFRQAGFAGVELEWRSPPSPEEVLVATGDAAHDTNVARVNQILFAPQDYALVATR